VEYKDYYKTLGVPRTASQAEIKKTFRKLARELHPDKNAGNKAAEKRFKDVNEANAVLSDPDKRKQYDTLGANWEAFARAGAGAGGAGASGDPFAGFRTAGGPGGGVRYEFRTSGTGGEGYSDFFRVFFGGEEQGNASSGGRRGGSTASGMRFEDILAQMGLNADITGRPGTQTIPRPPLEATAELSLEEAFHGTTRLVEVGGKRLEVTIPRGVDTGTRIRLSGKGGDGRDLIVICRVRPHPTFIRRGADLERELPLTLREALLGAEVPVRTLKGRVLLTVPEGTQNGRTFRLTGQGMPRFKAAGSGDLYVKTRVILPTSLSDEARKTAQRLFEQIDQPDPRKDKD
jgi:curved DNA-binding protein